MLKKLLLLGLLFSISTMFGQKEWTKAHTDSNDDVVFVESHMPSQFQLYSVDLDAIISQLKYVEMKDEVAVGASTTIISFPTENGTMEQFRMLEWSILEPSLADKFPMIKTFIGQSIKNPGVSLNMSFGTDGLHVMFRRPGKAAMLIDPYTRDRSKYILYTANNLPIVEGEFMCEFENEVESQTRSYSNDIAQRVPQDGKLRTYRLAIACTIEYAAYHLGNQGVSSGASLAVKKAAVLSAMVNTVNRVQGIYRLELGVVFTMIDNTSIIFIDSDNFTNNNAGNALIAESQSVITTAIGTGGFDVGHTFSTGGGGVASLGGICYSNAKARAITGSGTPIGDYYDVDYVAHEMGHHFGANHTFNTTTATNSCGAQRNTSTAGEPGGGSTIMAYAGICGAIPNVQNNSDAYFHYFSLLDINNRITSAPSCASIQNTGNAAPTAMAGADVVIPKGTAFILEGQATDSSPSAITYCWEQVDTGHAPEPLVSTATIGPAYRSLFPTESPKRFMPKFETVLGGSLQTQWEVTPTVGRSMFFALVTRDNDPVGGQTKADGKAVNVSGTAGPFVVTSQTASETWATGETKIINWNVANTTAFGVNTTNVKISLVDGSGSELAVLATSTPNDGSQAITVPNIVNSSTRIMVSAVGNIFYAINSSDIAVNAATVCTGLCSTAGDNGNHYDYVINSVNFNTINNSSPNTYTPYSDFTSISTNVVKGTSYTLTLSQYTIGGNYPSRAIVWIDWNGDCVFNTTDEQYTFPSLISDTAPVAISILVPNTTQLGLKTMRISLRNSTTSLYNAACETGFIGEAEDYTVNVTSAAGTGDINNFEGFTLSPNPNKGNFNISLKSENNNDVSIKVFDMIGRQIYSRNFDNNQSSFNQNINLNNVQPGVYLVNISDGVRFNSQRIIIK